MYVLLIEFTTIYNINFMGKKPQKCRKNCTKHHFILKPVQYFAYISRGVEVSFCPPTIKNHPIFPFFNKDRKHYTPAFFLKEDEPKYVTNDSIYKKEHQNFCIQQANGKSEMLIPKPRTKTPYCHICKEHYEDYSDHIQSQNHKTCINTNKFSEYIKELICQKYNDCQPMQQAFHEIQEQSFCDKQIASNTTISSSLVIEEPIINQGFTFVSGQGAFEIHQANKIQKLKSQGLLGDNKDAASPIFDNLLRRCSTTVQSGSEKKNYSFTKLPIIVTPLQ